MNPGLVVKLRPAGPWRIGPDSGARNQVDAIYHSDSLYAAVTSAMARLGSLADWLDATARSATPEVCFSSCFPFVDEIGFVPPPRTVWPPTSPSSMGGRVRWKSARFVPLGIVQSILAGHRLDDNQWTVDGASECLLPAGRQGPFRTGLRSNAAVDRLTGSTERHSTACLEFQAGAGLWAVVSFRDEAARARWIAPVQAAFRWLADSGFGGERSRGWGRSEPPEFVEGSLPEMILGTGGQGPSAGEQSRAAESRRLAEEEQGAAGEMIGEGSPLAPPREESSPEPSLLGAGGEAPRAGEEPAAAAKEPSPVPPVEEPPSEEPSPVPPVEEPPSEEPPVAPPAEEPPISEPPAEETAQHHTPDIAALPVTPPASPDEDAVQPHTPGVTAAPDPGAPPAEHAEQRQTPDIAAMPITPPASPDEGAVQPHTPAVTAVPEPPAPPTEQGEQRRTADIAAVPAAASASPDEEAVQPHTPGVTGAPESPAPGPPHPAPDLPPGPDQAHWLLSLFTPAADDRVDWRRGNYTLLTRSGRVDASGELKKQLPMIAEGSVVYAPVAPRGSAPDVAPDGFAHPVFRAGFAVSIPLPEVSG